MFKGVNQIRHRINNRSPIVYKFCPDTAQILEQYDSIIEALRANTGSYASALKIAARENTIYRGFRWILTERNSTEIPILPPTTKSNTYSIDYIAMIDIKREKIMKVFASQKDAAMSRNFKGCTTISRAIKNKSISSGHYWEIFEKCPDALKTDFLKNNKLPEQYVRPNSTIVEQISPTNGKVIERYNSVSDVTLKFKMSRLTLKKVSDKNDVYNGFKWKIIHISEKS